MSAAEGGWSIRLSHSAEADFADIIEWTADRFGEKQASVYAEVLRDALRAMTAGPDVLGAKERIEIEKGLFTMHVARHGRKGRHLVVFRIGENCKRPTIDVLRLLHEAMDLPFHASTSR